MYQACTVTKFRAVRPAVEKILRIGNPSMQAAVLHAVINHPSLASTRKIAGINSSKQQVTANSFVDNQPNCCRIIGVHKTHVATPHLKSTMQQRL